MRLMLVWEMASRLPTSMVSAARPHSTGTRSTSQGRQGRHEDAQQGGKTGRLGADRHEAGHRSGCALVDIRRPHVEGDGRDLEPETDQDQRRADAQQRQADRRPGARTGHGRNDLRQLGRAGGTEDQGNAVDDKPGGKAPSRKYLRPASSESRRGRAKAAST